MNIYEEYNKNNYNKLCLKLNAEKIFIGKDVNNIKFKGNSILLQTNSQEYYFIGSSIYKFKINEDIISYFSPVGNNDYPYPYAVSENNIYLMIDKIYFNKNLLQSTDPYHFYYKSTNNKKVLNTAFKTFKIKTIVEHLQ